MYKILLMLCFLVSFGCASKRTLNDNNAVSKDGVVKVWANWVKDKGKKFDVQFVMENIRDKAIIVKLHDMQCARGKKSGMLKHTFFNTGERTIDLQAGEIKQFNLVCNIGTDSSGPFNMRISKVYDNPSQDGATKGKIIAKSIIWSLPEDK